MGIKYQICTKSIRKTWPRILKYLSTFYERVLFNEK